MNKLIKTLYLATVGLCQIMTLSAPCCCPFARPSATQVHPGPGSTEPGARWESVVPVGVPVVHGTQPIVVGNPVTPIPLPPQQIQMHGPHSVGPQQVGIESGLSSAGPSGRDALAESGPSEGAGWLTIKKCGQIRVTSPLYQRLIPRRHIIVDIKVCSPEQMDVTVRRDMCNLLRRRDTHVSSINGWINWGLAGFYGPDNPDPESICLYATARESEQGRVEAEMFVEVKASNGMTYTGHRIDSFQVTAGKKVIFCLSRPVKKHPNVLSLLRFGLFEDSACNTIQRGVVVGTNSCHEFSTCCCHGCYRCAELCADTLEPGCEVASCVVRLALTPVAVVVDFLTGGNCDYAGQTMP